MISLSDLYDIFSDCGPAATIGRAGGGRGGACGACGGDGDGVATVDGHAGTCEGRGLGGSVATAGEADPGRVAATEIVATPCRRVTTDSRKIAGGDIFFALKGDNFDGNSFAAGAFAAGAAAVVIDSREVYGNLTAGQKALTVLAADSLTALQEFARMHREKLGIPVLAITGSNGKTTTKELILRVLSRKFRTAATAGNLNNHIGVPLTLLAIEPGTEFAVVEMGANHRGEIRRLCEIALPDYGLITNIGLAHLEGFGGSEGVKLGKGELFDHLGQTHGTAFYLADSGELTGMAGDRAGLATVPYSASGFRTVAEGGMLALATDRGETVKTRLTGDYNAYNVAAAIAVGRYFGVNERDIAAAIESYEPDNNRSQRVKTARNTVILDAYNANPSSMRAALANFGEEKTGQPKVVILGDMRELGEYSSREHAAIIDLLGELRIDRVFLAGPEFCAAAAGTAAATAPVAPAANAVAGTERDRPGCRAAASPVVPASAAGTTTCTSGNAAPTDTAADARAAVATPASTAAERRYLCFADTSELKDYLEEHPVADSVVLVKGSRGMGLESILPLL